MMHTLRNRKTGRKSALGRFAEARRRSYTAVYPHLAAASGITQKRPMRVTSKPANDKTRDIDTGERAYSLRQHEQCLERRKETTSHRTGEARMAFAADRASHWCPS